MKALNELALKAGASLLCPETGFVHAFYPKRESRATIPVYENLLWALAHFQKRTQEGVQEGKRLVERLLSFQNSDGEFPVYLHEFPEASDHFLGAHLFLPLWWIRSDFGSVLGGELLEQLSRCLKALSDALKRRYQEKRPRGLVALKVGAALFAMEGSDAILKESALATASSSEIADLELAKDLRAPHLPSWPALSWHPRLQTYLGPAFKEMQEGAEPFVTLLEHMMGSTRVRELSHHHLAAALIRSAPTPSQDTPKGIRQGECWGYSALGTEGEAHHPGFHLFRYLTEGEGRIDSLSLPPSHLKQASFVEGDDSIKFYLALSPTSEAENKREIELFVNVGPRISTSLFRLNEPVEIQFAKTTLTLTFRLHSGSGDFVGHLSRGNRPSQILKGEAFDQVLSLRTLRRSRDAVIELEIAWG